MHRQTSTSLTCDPNASCSNGGCVCNAGYVGTGLSCTRTFLRQAHTVSSGEAGVALRHRPVHSPIPSRVAAAFAHAD